MNDLSNKSSKELAAELQESMPEMKSYVFDWYFDPYAMKRARYAIKKLYHVSQLVLAQQQEIEQLKAELDELKKR